MPLVKEIKTGGYEFGTTNELQKVHPLIINDLRRFCGKKSLILAQTGQILRNLGEGPIQAIVLALKEKELLVIHDYEGVGYWGRGEWKHSDPDAGRLRDCVQYAKSKGFQITFQWAKRHAGTYGNERADTLAGEPPPKTPHLHAGDPSSSQGLHVCYSRKLGQV